MGSTGLSAEEFRRLRQRILEQEALQAKRREEEAWAEARAVASWLRKKYGVSQVYLYGSLAWGGFWEHSDIDLLVEGFPKEGDFWAMQAGADRVGGPFPVSIVLEEDAVPSLREKAKTKGVKLLEPA